MYISSKKGMIQTQIEEYIKGVKNEKSIRFSKENKSFIN